jgi:hypothetical protein
MGAPEMRERIAKIGLIPVAPPSLADTQAFVASEREKWSKLVKSLGLAGSQ